jgi:hypothetical protein
MLDAHVLLIGHGSIGKFHVDRLTNLVKNVDVVEPLSSNRTLRNPQPDKCEIRFYSEIAKLPDNRVYEFAVIANWGPDHVKTILSLLDRGVTKFLVEKPLCDSLFDLRIIESLVSEGKIEIISHYQWSYSFLPNLIEETALKYNLGKTISIVVNGGAKCLVTNGIHYLALAEVLFNESPNASSIIYENDAINPRNKKFVFLEGNATWQYPNSKYLSINFFNKSHMSIFCIINFEFGYGIIQGENIDIYAIPVTKRDQITSPTKTANATDLVFSGSAYTFPDGRDGSDVIYSKLFDGINDEDAFHGIRTIKDLLLTLSKNITTKIDRNLSSMEIGQIEKNWNLS